MSGQPGRSRDPLTFSNPPTSSVHDKVKLFNTIEERSRVEKFSNSIKSKVRATAEHAHEQVSKYVVKQAVKYELVDFPTIASEAVVAINGDDFHSRYSYIAISNDAMDKARLNLPKGHVYVTDSEGRTIGTKPKSTPSAHSTNVQVSDYNVSAKPPAGLSSGIIQHPTILRPGKKPQFTALPPVLSVSNSEENNGPIYYVPIEQDIKANTWNGTSTVDKSEAAASKAARRHSTWSLTDFSQINTFRRPSSTDKGTSSCQISPEADQAKVKRRNRTTAVYEYKPYTAEASSINYQKPTQQAQVIDLPSTSSQIKRKPLPPTAAQVSAVHVTRIPTLKRKPGMDPLATTFHPRSTTVKPTLDPKASTFHPGDRVLVKLHPGFRTLDPKARKTAQSSRSNTADELFMTTPSPRNKAKTDATESAPTTMSEYIHQRSVDNKADKSRNRYHEVNSTLQDAVDLRDEYRRRKNAQKINNDQE